MGKTNAALQRKKSRHVTPKWELCAIQMKTTVYQSKRSSIQLLSQRGTQAAHMSLATVYGLTATRKRLYAIPSYVESAT
jgi:hypothetical protein